MKVEKGVLSAETSLWDVSRGSSRCRVTGDLFLDAVTLDGGANESPLQTAASGVLFLVGLQIGMP